MYILLNLISVYDKFITFEWHDDDVTRFFAVKVCT